MIQPLGALLTYITAVKMRVGMDIAFIPCPVKNKMAFRILPTITTSPRRGCSHSIIKMQVFLPQAQVNFDGVRSLGMTVVIA